MRGVEGPEVAYRTHAARTFSTTVALVFLLETQNSILKQNCHLELHLTPVCHIGSCCLVMVVVRTKGDCS
jgi:hypothetical protein